MVEQALTNIANPAGVDPARLMDAWAGLSPATQRAYAADWSAVRMWLLDGGRATFPVSPADLADYIADRPEASMAVLSRRLAAVAWLHRHVDVPSPTQTERVRVAVARARRERRATPPPRRAAPVTRDVLAMMLAATATTQWPAMVSATRTRAVLLGGFVSAARRSELAALQRRDVQLPATGAGRLLVRTSKTDQEGHGEVLVIPRHTDPVWCVPCALWAWIDMVDAHDAAGTPTAGVAAVAAVAFTPRTGHRCARDGVWDEDPRPLLRRITKSGQISAAGISGESVHRIVTTAADAAGISGVSGHSLRAGFITEAAAQGIPEDRIARQSRHKDLSTLRGYVRHYSPETANAAMDLRL